ncbi:MAG: hypothetical protein MJ091_01935 [Clostridia bacterium]|nr:hypothetical protein [Clostridia bacterium]
MSVVSKVNHIFEPNPLACGQAVLAMISGKDVYEIIAIVGKETETDLKDMKSALSALSVKISNERKQAFCKDDLPNIALLSLETPKCWHWSLYFKGTFFDPEYGVIDDFPECARKYYWEIKDE